MEIRDARTNDCDALTDLALRSKAHWGYDESFIDACRRELTITPARLADERVRVAEHGGTIVGFSSLSIEGDTADVMDLFVEPGVIGRGIGRLLWDDLLEGARAHGAVRILIEADPHAEDWYRARGARRIGEAPSGSIPGRRLPLLEYPVPGTRYPE